MKSKIFSGIMLAIGLLTGFTSCASDDNDDNNLNTLNQANTDANMVDYTVIFWGSAGGNDAWVVSDMSTLLLDREDGKISDRVNFVGCLDPSSDLENDMKAKNMAGVLEFELGTKRNTSADTLSVFKNLSGAENEDKLEKQEETNRKAVNYPEYYSTLMHSMKSMKTNSEYDIYSSASLQQFIGKAAKEHPAKNYILMLYGHGNGFLPAIESGSTIESRACVHKAGDLRTTLHLSDITSAIKNSGVKISTVFYQCCDMATLENMGDMKDCTDYVVASSEPTGGGYYPTFITYLNEVGSSVEGMKSACRKTVNYYVENCLNISGQNDLSSHGFYDLSKIDELFVSVKQAANWFANAAKSNPQYMKDVVYNSVIVMATSYKSILHIEDLDYAKTNSYRKNVHNMLMGGKINATSTEEIKELLRESTYLNLPGNISGVCLASMMEAALCDKVAAEAEGLDMQALERIYNNYMSTLKSMAYIRCNGVETNDMAYRLASPSVNLFSLNEKVFYQGKFRVFFNKENMSLDNDKVEKTVNDLEKYIAAGDQDGAYNIYLQLFGGNDIAYYNDKLDMVKANYKSTAFDMATGWSQVMESIDYNPTLGMNPTRYDATH